MGNKNTAIALVLLAGTLVMPAGAVAKNTGLRFVANERSNTITVLDSNDQVTRTFETCARPRGMHFAADRKTFFVGCADDDVIAIYDAATQELVGRIRNVAAPETFDLHPNGRHLYVSNEEDAAISVFDVTSGEFLGEFLTGEEPEGVQVTADGRLVFVASEVADMVHVIDTVAGEIIKNILVESYFRRNT